MSSPSDSSTSLLNSAVKFLQDDKVKDAPLAKKISFLESKGVSAADIQRALTMSLSPPSTSVTTPDSPPLPANGVPPPYLIRVNQGYSWKDAFIATVLMSGSSYALFHLLKVL